MNKILAIIAILLLSSLSLLAQGPPPPPDPPPPGAVPLGGIGLLLAAGAALGFKKLHDKGKQE